MFFRQIFVNDSLDFCIVLQKKKTDAIKHRQEGRYSVSLSFQLLLHLVHFFIGFLHDFLKGNILFFIEYAVAEITDKIIVVTGVENRK